MSHTPGPLYAIPNPQWRGAKWAIATDPNADWARYDHIAHVVGEGNARLFAAAPELLEACEAAESCFYRGGANTPRMEWHTAYLKLLRAIAKAKGQQP